MLTDKQWEAFLKDGSFKDLTEEKLNRIIDEEAEKPVDETDTDLIEYCLETAEKLRKKAPDKENGKAGAVRPVKLRLKKNIVTVFAAVLFIIGSLFVSAAVLNIIPYDKYFSEKINFTDDKGREYFVNPELPDTAVISGAYIKKTAEEHGLDIDTDKIADNTLYCLDVNDNSFYRLSKEKIRIKYDGPFSMSSYYEGGYSTTKDGVYCVSQKNEFIRIDYSGKVNKLFAPEKSSIVDFIVYEDVAFVLTDTGTLFRIYLPEKKYENVYEGIDLTNFVGFVDIYSNCEIGWTEENPLFRETAYRNGFPESEKGKIVFDEYSEYIDCFDFNIGTHIIHYLNTQTEEHRKRENNFFNILYKNAPRKWWLTPDDISKYYNIFTDIDLGKNYWWVALPQTGDFGGAEISRRLFDDSFGKQGEFHIRFDLKIEYDGEKLTGLNDLDPYFSFDTLKEVRVNENGISYAVGECKYKAFDYSDTVKDSFFALWTDKNSSISYILILNSDGYSSENEKIGSDISFDEFCEIAENIPIDKEWFK